MNPRIPRQAVSTSATLPAKESGMNRGSYMNLIDEDVSPGRLLGADCAHWYQDLCEPEDAPAGSLNSGPPVLGPHFLRGEW